MSLTVDTVQCLLPAETKKGHFNKCDRLGLSMCLNTLAEIVLFDYCYSNSVQEGPNCFCLLYHITYFW